MSDYTDHDWDEDEEPEDEGPRATRDSHDVNTHGFSDSTTPPGGLYGGANHPSRAPITPTPVVAIYPMPVKLPAQIPADSLLLKGFIECPECSTMLTHAHCNSSSCVMLWCDKCDVIVRYDEADDSARLTWYSRRTHKIAVSPPAE